ncbi:MAG: trypsin-like peptidase domain-containing protein [Acutalibacteraceae bacterium]|nr:trypsin-like peptidase domain-containing protein [Acutalibacteraceae bacterium]
MEENRNFNNSENEQSFLDGIIPKTEENTTQNPYLYYQPPKPKPPKKPKKYGIGVVVASVILAMVMGAVSGVGSTVFLDRYNTPETAIQSDDGQGIINTTINVEKVSNSAIEAVAEKASPSVVGIRTTMAVNNFFGGSEDYTAGEGSGIIYTEDGYIITNYHVLENAIKASSGKIEVFLNEDNSKSYSAKVIGYNISYDLAVIKIDGKNLKAVELGDSDKLKRGQYVAAIGCPGGLDFMGSVSYGIISGLNRQVNESTKESISLIQTDAAINPGNSGGALLDIEGKLIGVNSSKISATEYEGMGFAIPINTVKEICNKIIENKDKPQPYVGISLSETYDEQTLNRLGFPSGAVVSSVATDSPAYAAGIRRGDIITEFASQKISNYNDLYDAISNCTAGEKVSVKLYRSGKYYKTDITVLSNN